MEDQESTSNLPSVLKISKFSVARGREIQILNRELSSCTGIKLAFQKLPKHMRRRAMSHNVKRLPRRLREIHLSQMTKSGLPPKLKRPSRKYRRRPSNLTSDYARRQRRCTWLNTHIWHAKRFHMVEKWGYKLPYCPCDRAFKACYRATIKHCLLQDISFYSCVEISGDTQIIQEGFAKIMDRNVDLSICAKYVLSGLRQGQFTLLQYSTKNPVGQVYFIWRPCKENKRSLWLWVHGAFKHEALESLKNCFSFKSSNENPDIYRNGTLELRDLKHELSRFRLTGPLSNKTICNAFKIIDPEKNDDKNSDWINLFLREGNDNYMDKMSLIWKNLQMINSPAEIAPHIVFPLLIYDPRFNLPKKRSKPIISYSSVSVDPTIWNNVLDSPLWDLHFRKMATDNKLSQAEIGKLREKLLVPGSDLDEIPTVLPIILIQRPGKKTKDFNGYGSGWDILMPSAWAQPVWLSLIMWGGRSGGLQEMDSVVFESDQQPLLCPDTESGKNEETHLSHKLKETFFKLPPNKRPNFNKLGISCPFEWNWQLLLNEWGCDLQLATNFKVLRCKKSLKQLQDGFKRSNLDMLLLIQENTLIPVSMKFSTKGSCTKLAIICLPKDADLKGVLEEPFHKDENETKRKMLRQEHKDLLKCLRRKRQRAKRVGEKIPIDMEILDCYSQKMRQLWVPDTKTIRYSCSREVMGFVTHGDFSFLMGKTKAIGYVTLNSLRVLLQSHINKVLVRNTNSRQYRLATLEIITDV